MKDITHLNVTRNIPVLVDSPVCLGRDNVDRDRVVIAIDKERHKRSEINEVRREVKGAVANNRPGGKSVCV